MVAQLLAHIDTLDAALQNLSERIEHVLAPHAQIIELLSTIPGVQKACAAEVLIAECGLGYVGLPDGWALRVLGRRVPRPPRIGRSQAVRADPSRARVADLAAHRMRPRRGPHERHLSRRALRPAPRAPRRAESDRCDPPRPARRVLPHRPRPQSHTAISDPTGSASATPRRAPRPTPAAPTRSTGLRRHPRPARPTSRTEAGLS